MADPIMMLRRLIVTCSERYRACLKALRESTIFSVQRCTKTALVDTLRAAGAEDKPLLGSKLSADSGAKTRLGLGES